MYRYTVCQGHSVVEMLSLHFQKFRLQDCTRIGVLTSNYEYVKYVAVEKFLLSELSGYVRQYFLYVYLIFFSR